MEGPDVAADSDDPEFEHELREAVARFDPVPAELLRHAIDGFGWRTIDAELAELTFDSLVDRDAALVRGGSRPRLLTFRAGGVSIEVEVDETGASRTLVGQLLPPRSATIEIRHSTGTVTQPVDDLGRFVARGLSAGAASLRCRLGPEAPTVVTDWVTI
jgi:hypothetical protein